MIGDEFVDRPPVLVVASPAAGADRRHLGVLLERGKGHVPGFARLLIHGSRIAANLGVISFALALLLLVAY